MQITNHDIECTDAPVPYPTMHHFVTEMCTCVHISATKRCIVEYMVHYGISEIGLLEWNLMYFDISSHGCHLNHWEYCDYQWTSSLEFDLSIVPIIPKCYLRWNSYMIYKTAPCRWSNFCQSFCFHMCKIIYVRIYRQGMGLLPDTQNCLLRMRRECRERLPRQRQLAIPTCIPARAWRTCRDTCQDR